MKIWKIVLFGSSELVRQVCVSSWCPRNGREGPYTDQDVARACVPRCKTARSLPKGGAPASPWSLWHTHWPRHTRSLDEELHLSAHLNPCMGHPHRKRWSDKFGWLSRFGAAGNSAARRKLQSTCTIPEKTQTWQWKWMECDWVVRSWRCPHWFSLVVGYGAWERKGKGRREQEEATLEEAGITPYTEAKVPQR